MKIWTIEKKVAVETVNTDIAGSKNLRAPETYWFIGKIVELIQSIFYYQNYKVQNKKQNVEVVWSSGVCYDIDLKRGIFHHEFWNFK